MSKLVPIAPRAGRRPRYSLLWCAAALSLLGCSQGGLPDAPGAAGTRGAACYGNGTCNAELRCQANLCVAGSGPDGGVFPLDGGPPPGDGGTLPGDGGVPPAASGRVVASTNYRDLNGL